MKAEIEYSDLKRIIKATKKFVGSRWAASIMQYVKLEIDGKKVTAIALDGHKIAVEKANVKNCDEPFTCLIKPELPIVKGYKGYCTIELIDCYALITIDDITKRFKQPDGEYYKTDDLLCLKNQDGFRIGFDPKKLKEALEKISEERVVLAFTDSPKAPVLIFDEKGNQRIVLPINITNSEFFYRGLENEQANEQQGITFQQQWKDSDCSVRKRKYGSIYLWITKKRIKKSWEQQEKKDINTVKEQQEETRKFKPHWCAATNNMCNWDEKRKVALTLDVDCKEDTMCCCKCDNTMCGARCGEAVNRDRKGE